MNLGAKKHIRDSEVVVVGFVNRLLWRLQCGRLLLSRLLIEYVGDNPYLALTFRGHFNPFSWCSWAFSNLEWWPSNEKILKSYPNSFVQVVKCFSKLKNGDKLLGKEKNTDLAGTLHLWISLLEKGYYAYFLRVGVSLCL
jgi:hypothetical protein